MVLRTVFIILLPLQCTLLFSQSSKSNAAQGSLLYKDSLYDKSIERYNESLKQEPNNEYLFNLGNSYLKSGDLENAKKTYSQLLNSSSASDQLKSKSAYNLGNLSYAEQNLNEAIINYKNALHLNPDDVQASENLQIALAQQQEQEQEQEQQQEGQEANQDKRTKDVGSTPQPKEKSDQAENEKKSSKSEHIDIDKADEIMKYLDQLEKNTRERLNSNKNNEGDGANKKPEKDW